jgi:protein pelota
LKIFELNQKKGIAKVEPESLDDLWHLYNLIYEKDLVYARTSRSLKREKEYGRHEKSRRVSVFLGIEVEKVVWDRTLNRLRVYGTICEAPEDVAGKGSHHTINVTVNKPITIVKSKWLKHQLDRLKRASQRKGTPIIVASIDDESFCIAFLQQFGVDIKIEKSVALPSKLEADKRSGVVQNLLNEGLITLREFWEGGHNPIVVIGVGFLKNRFVNYLKQKAPEIVESIIDVKSVNHHGVVGIHEALRSGVLTKALESVRVMEETKVMEEVLERLGKGSRDVTYGFNEVEKASKFGAVEELVLADATFREASEEKRIALEKMMREVEEKRGKVVVISTEHEAGAQLLSLGGVVALLRFPVN